jgi:hypothetical protein
MWSSDLLGCAQDALLDQIQKMFHVTTKEATVESQVLSPGLFSIPGIRVTRVLVTCFLPLKLALKRIHNGRN